MIGENQKGLEGLPLQLTIIAIVLGITIPIIVGALYSYDRFNTEQQLRNELGILANAVKKVFLGTLNSSDTVTLHLNDGFFTKLEYIKVGGPITQTTNTTMIVYKLIGMGEGRIVITNPNVRMCSEKNDTFEMGRGVYTLILTCKSNSSVGIYVEITRAD